MGVAIIRGKGIQTTHMVQFNDEMNQTFMERVISYCCMIHKVERQNTITIEWVWNK